MYSDTQNSDLLSDKTFSMPSYKFLKRYVFWPALYNDYTTY